MFHAGFTSFHDNMEAEDDEHGWAATTCNRYRTSLLQIALTLKAIFEDRNEDIEDAAAWEIGLAEVTEFVALRKDAGVSLATINRDLTAFDHLMKHVKNKGWIELNPVQLFEKQREKLPRIVLPTEEALAKLSERAPGTLTYFPGFLDEAGGRITEMAMIKWSDLSRMKRPVEGNVTLTLQNTKGGKARTITLRQQSNDILLQISRSNRSP